MFVGGRCLYKRFKCLRILMNFLCLYLGDERGRGVALMHVYVWNHSQPLLQNRLMDINETW